MTPSEQLPFDFDGAQPSREVAKFQATPGALGRLLVLIDGFSREPSGQPRSLEGRVKLAKLDFLLRYPGHLVQVLRSRGVSPRTIGLIMDADDDAPLDARMVRYRYGPWDPAYFALLGSLIGRELVQAVPLAGRGGGFGYRTAPRGAELTMALVEDGSFSAVSARVAILRRHLDLSGSTLKDTLYTLPDVADARWHQEL